MLFLIYFKMKKNSHNNNQPYGSHRSLPTQRKFQNGRILTRTEQEQNFKMAFSKAMPEPFCVTLFNGSCDNDEINEPRVFIGRVSTAHLLYLQNNLCCFYCVT